MKSQEIRFIKGRIIFDGAKAGAPFPSAIVIFDPARVKERIVIKSMDYKNSHLVGNNHDDFFPWQDDE